MSRCCADELHGLVGVTLRHRRLRFIGQQFGHLVVADQRHHALAGLERLALHVVGVGDAQVMVEALFRRQELGLIPEVPFADAHGRVALRFDEIRDRVFLRVQTFGLAGKIDARHRNPCAVATREQLRPRDRTHRSRIEAGELHSLRRHPVEVGRAIQFRSIGPDVSVAHVIDEDDHKIGLACGRGGSCGTGRGLRRQGEGGECEQNVFHGEGSVRCGGWMLNLSSPRILTEPARNRKNGLAEK